MTDGLQPEYVDAPTCRVCGVALADHPKVSELCRTVFTLAAKVQRLVAYETCTGEIECTCWVCLSERVKRQKGEIERLRAERNALKDACHRNKRKWRHGWKQTLDEIVRSWQRIRGKKDAEIERLSTELAKLKRYLASSAGGWTEVAHLTAERDRLKQAIATLISKSQQQAGNLQNPYAWIAQRDWEEFVKEVQGA